MIKKWILQYFKSVYEKITLDFAPLTIFSGANGSGKSTIIQSLLLTTQTLQNSVYDRPIILNGHIIKAGSFKDIVSNGHEKQNILIGFELSSDFDKTDASISNFHLPPDYISRQTREFLTNCEFQFSTKNSNENIELQPQLEQCNIKIDFELISRSSTNQDVKSQIPEINIVRTTKALEKRLKSSKLSKENLQISQLSSLDYEVRMPDRMETGAIRFYSYFPTTGTYVGASLKHFLPDRLSIVFNETEEQINRLVETVVEVETYYNYYLFLRNPETELNFPGKAKDLILNTIEESIEDFIYTAKKTKPKDKFLKELENLKNNFSMQGLDNCYALLSSPDKKTLQQKLNTKREELENYLKSNQTTKYSLTYVPLPDTLDTAVNYIKKFFTHFVKSLGPLRDEPKPVYSLAEATDSKDIGYRGQHTAAVLEVHRNTKVKYIPSERFELGNFTPEIIERPLVIAVLDWLKYMGIANDVKTSDKGVLGYELKVAISETQALHDLTHVGVGVSQVLPILVQSLLADRGSTLIFEQPELHLHPKVQTRLADFFISMIMLNKQCIVETHSEYLINRLRYLSVTSTDSQISDNVMIYFVEKHGEKSHYRPIKINEFGVIEDWPKGFFDENEQNSRAIIKAAMEKRKKSITK